MRNRIQLLLLVFLHTCVIKEFFNKSVQVKVTSGNKKYSIIISYETFTYR